MRWCDNIQIKSLNIWVRLKVWVRHSSVIHPTTRIILLFISKSTAIYARILVNWEQDLKKIFVLSTLRQTAIIIFTIYCISANRAIIFVKVKWLKIQWWNWLTFCWSEKGNFLTHAYTDIKFSDRSETHIHQALPTDFS